MIHHTVFFRLKHDAGSAAEAEFLEAAQELAEISGVRDFRRLRQTSSKAPWDFGLAMAFEDQASYEAYCAHPLHQAFVEERWMTEVEAFQEIDYSDYDSSE